MKHGCSKLNKLLPVVCLAALLIFTGFSFLYEPKLKNASEPFIDLDEGAVVAIRAAGEAEEKNGTPSESAQEEREDTERTDPGTESSATESEGEIEILVSDDVIRVKYARFTDAESFRKLVDGGEFTGESVILVDDYAEARAFRAAMRILDNAKVEYTIETR